MTQVLDLAARQRMQAQAQQQVTMMRFDAAKAFLAGMLPLELAVAMRRAQSEANPLGLDPAVHGDGEGPESDGDLHLNIRGLARVALTSADILLEEMGIIAIDRSAAAKGASGGVPH